MSVPPLPSDPELATYRTALQARLRTLQREIAADRERVADDIDDARAVQDRKDQAGSAVQAGVDEAEWVRDLDEEREVRAALLRIEQGRFGRCADCGEPIGRERLAVQPAAARCAACQAKSEPQRGRR
jgi:RNA polymerase-binding transcription factor DksA